MAKWISVDDEKKPPLGKRFILCCKSPDKNKFLTVGQKNNFGDWITFENITFSIITHWLDELEMPEK